MSDEHGILATSMILDAYGLGDIVIDPFNNKQLNSTSYDLTLGDEGRVYTSFINLRLDTIINPVPRRQDGVLPIHDGTEFFHRETGVLVLDAKRQEETYHFRLHPRGFVLKPGIGYLLHTREKIWTKKYNPVIDGKSSIGRLFVTVHETAGYGDPDFDGQYTLEVVVLYPTMVYPGMRIGQIRFHTIVGVPTPYRKKGHYVGEGAQGPVASRSWAQFETEEESAKKKNTEG